MATKPYHSTSRIRNRLLLGSLTSFLLISAVLGWQLWIFDTAQQNRTPVSWEQHLMAGLLIGGAALIGSVFIIALTLQAVRRSRLPLEQVAQTLQQNVDQPLRISSQGDPALKMTISAFNELHERIERHQAELDRQMAAVEREREHDEAVVTMTRLLTSSLEIEPLLTEFVRSLSTNFDLALSAVGMVEANGIPVRHGLTQSEDGLIQPLATQWLPLTTGIAGEAVHHRYAVIRRNPPFDTLLHAPGAVGTQIALPLLNTGQVMAVLLVQTVQTLNERSIQRIMDVADHLAAALANAQLYSNARERATSLTAINELARAISSSLDTKRILDTALQQIRQLVPYDVASVALFNADHNHFSTVVANDAYRGALEDDQTFSAVGTSLRTAFEAGHPVYLADIHAASDHVLFPPFDQTARSLLLMPLTTSDARLGTLNLMSRTPNAFTDGQISLMGGLSHFLTTALINGRLYSQRAQALEELEATQEHLVFAEKLRALGELASGVTHDFNNLLAGILGNTQLLLLEITDPEQVETLRVIEKAAKDGAETVKRIQGFSRSESGHPDAPVELHLLVRDAIELTRVRWRNTAQEKGINIEMQRELNEVPTIRGHAPELREVITNLIINAIDAMPNGGILRVATGQRGAEVFMSVADSGVGMSQEVQNRIFNPFFSTKGEKGNGLGLSVSAAIVTRHGGRIEVQSKEGRGTNFVIWLPILEVDFDEVAAHDAEIPTIQGRILIVEDEELVRIALSRMLSAWGHTVVSAEGGREGLMKFRPGAFDIVISDLGMPDMMGWDVLRHIREREANIHTILLSGWARQLDPAEAKVRGVDLVVTKPFDQLTLRRTIAHLLDGTLDMTPRIIG